VLAGCSTTVDHNIASQDIYQQWQFNGKFAIKTPTEVQSAKINWSQINQHYDINLYTTFGITVMKIKGHDNFVEIEGVGDPVSGPSAEQLIWQLTRWHIPVNQLSHWVKGDVVNAIAPQFNQRGQFEQGHILDSKGQQWLLTLGGYKTIGLHTRPTKLKLTKDTMYLKLAISQWHIQQ